jgi:hypothetical protein
MNFDELKSDWNNEPVKEVKIPENMERFGKSTLPIEQVKKMMKKELLIQLGGLIIFGFLPLVFKFPDYHFTTISGNTLFYLLYGFMFFISILYIYKFYKFYIYMDNYNVNTKDGLYEVYYELKLNLEAYKTWSYSITPILIVLILQICQATKMAINPNGNPFENIYVIGLIVIVSTLYMYWATEWWIAKFYKAHLSRLKSILYDLNEDEAQYENSLEMANEKSVGSFSISKMNKDSWYKIIIIIGILFSMGFFFGRWLARGGF